MHLCVNALAGHLANAPEGAAIGAGFYLQVVVVFSEAVAQRSSASAPSGSARGTNLLPQAKG